jgi:hypothetical protein
MFDVFCEVVNEEELDELLADVEAELNDDTEESEELDEAVLSGAETGPRKTPGSHEAAHEPEDDEDDEETDDDEAGLVVAEEVYHPSYTSAIQTAIAAAKKRGYEVDADDYQSKVASGPRKPSEGKTVSHNIKLTKDGKPTKKGLAIQVYNRGGDKTPYELNHYISEEKDEPPFEPTGSTTNAKTPRNVAKRLAQKAMKQAMKDKADTKK